jgi:hypothetical protein
MKLPLFQSNINSLRKVRDMLNISCKMSGSQVVLSEPNKTKLQEAKKLIEQADSILQSIY